MKTKPVLTLRAAIGDTDTSSRTIAGDFVPYGVVGYTSMGPTIFLAGSLTAPDELRRVKLLVQHDTSSPAVGYMTALTDGDDAAHGEWTLPEGEAGDEALRLAADGLRDGLSLGVKLQAYDFDAVGNLVVSKASLFEVSLVTIPAFDDARLDVAAARKELTMNRAQLDAAYARGEITKADYDAQCAALTAAATPAPAPAGTPAGTPAAPLPTLDAGQLQQPAPTMVMERQADPVQAGQQARAGLQAAVAATEAFLAAGKPLGMLRAELEDITSTTTGHVKGDEDGVVGGDTYLGEVWRASKVRRPLIDAGNKKPLTGLRVYGWHWVEGQTPKVELYDGEKGPIPSNTWKTTTVDAEAQPFAGGWDVERKLIDLGAPGLVETAFQKATDDYRLNSETWVAGQLRTAATAVPEQLSLTAALAAVGMEASKIGASIGYVQFGSAVWAEFIELSADEVPWWLKEQGSINLGTVSGNAGGMSFEFNSELGAREVMAGDGNAHTFYEVDPPIRVRAENIPNGGVDLGVFGYGALIVNDSRAIFRTTIAAPVAAVEA